MSNRGAPLLRRYTEGWALWGARDGTDQPVAYAPRDPSDGQPWIDAACRRYGDDDIVISPPYDEAHKPSLPNTMVAVATATLAPAASAEARSELSAWALTAWCAQPLDDGPTEERITAAVVSHLAALDDDALARLCRWTASRAEYLWLPRDRGSLSALPDARARSRPGRDATEAFLLGMERFASAAEPSADDATHVDYDLGREWAHRATGRQWEDTY